MSQTQIHENRLIRLVPRALAQQLGPLSTYRLLIALILLVMFNLQWLNQSVDQANSQLFMATLLCYALIHTGVLSLSQNNRLAHSTTLLLGLALLDIVSLNLLIMAETQQTQTLSLLFIVIIIGSATALPPRLSLLIAALATLSILAQSLAQYLYHQASSEALISAGMLGTVFFITAVAVQGLFHRASQHERLVRSQAVDIVELQQLTDNIVHQMRTGIVVIDDQGKISLINEAARLLLGLQNSASELIGQNIPVALVNTWRRWHDNPQQLPPIFRARAGGPEVQASFTSLINPGTQQSLVFLEDTRLITQQAQAMKLASLGRLTGSIAHEIRNPLGAISHAAQLLGETEALAANDRKLCDIIKAQSLRVNQVIENVLALSRRTDLKPRLIDLNAHVQAFIDAYHCDWGAAQISVDTLHDKLEVKFDPSQLDQVLTNLFDNGLRYSHQRTGSPTLMVRTRKEDTDNLPLLEIIDQGHGIAEADLPEIFEPFYTTESKGTGLGLYLAREICEAHQAQLSYVTTSNQQSCFQLIFAHPRKRWLA